MLEWAQGILRITTCLRAFIRADIKLDENYCLHAVQLTYQGMIKSAQTVLLTSLLLSGSGGSTDIGSPTQAIEGQQLPSSCIVVHVPQVGVGNGGQDVGQL